MMDRTRIPPAPVPASHQVDVVDDRKYQKPHAQGEIRDQPQERAIGFECIVHPAPSTFAMRSRLDTGAQFAESRGMGQGQPWDGNFPRTDSRGDGLYPSGIAN